LTNPGKFITLQNIKNVFDFRLRSRQGTFEQMVNGLTFAAVVPNIVIAATSEWLFSIPMNLIRGHPYWWNAACEVSLALLLA
jgi:hypothetical protein